MISDNDRTSTERLFLEAVELRDKGDLDSSIEKLKEILHQNERVNAAVLGYLGNIYWDLGDLESARKCYKRSTQLNPGSELASLGYFHTLWDMGKFRRAVAEARRFLSKRDSEEYFRMIEEMRDAFVEAGIEVGSIPHSTKD